MRPSNPSSVSKGIDLAVAIWYWPKVVEGCQADFELAKQHGYTHMKVDFWWHSLEPTEGALETDGLMKILDTAEKEGMPVILNLFGAPEPGAPHWAYEKFRDAWFVDDCGKSYGPGDGHLVLAGTGAYPGLCWDSPQVRQATESFFVRLIEALKGHAAVAAWNVWAEPMTEPARTFGPERKFCYCGYTQQAFREWLMAKHGTIEDLNAAWGSTYTEWRQIRPPGPPKRHHAPWAAWKTFLADRAAANMAWRYEIFKKQDPDHPVSAYARGFSGSGAANWDIDDWKLQKPVDRYGVSFYQALHFRGNEADPASWMNHFDGIRSSCEGTKEGQYFLGENQVSQVQETAQIPPWQMRMSRLAALACGASGIWDWLLRLPYPRAWWASFGLASPDGTPGPWADEIAAAHSLVRKISEYWEMPRVRSHVAILFDPQSYYFCDAYGRLDLIEASIQGFYRMAWDSGAPADYVHADFLSAEELARYKTLFIPYQPTVSAEMARILTEYVREGGTVIAEAGFGYQKEHGWAADEVPHRMQEVFGCKTQGIFAADTPRIRSAQGVLKGVRYWEYYAPTTGQVIGRHPDGSAGIVRSKFGNGSALLIGTLVGAEYQRSRAPLLRRLLSPYISSEVTVANKMPPGVFTARLVQCRNHDILFLLNFADRQLAPTVRLKPEYGGATSILTEAPVRLTRGILSVKVAPRSGEAFLLRRA